MKRQESYFKTDRNKPGQRTRVYHIALAILSFGFLWVPVFFLRNGGGHGVAIATILFDGASAGAFGVEADHVRLGAYLFFLLLLVHVYLSLRVEMLPGRKAGTLVAARVLGVLLLTLAWQVYFALALAAVDVPVLIGTVLGNLPIPGVGLSLAVLLLFDLALENLIGNRNHARRGSTWLRFLMLGVDLFAILTYLFPFLVVDGESIYGVTTIVPVELGGTPDVVAATRFEAFLGNVPGLALPLRIAFAALFLLALANVVASLLAFAFTLRLSRGGSLPHSVALALSLGLLIVLATGYGFDPLAPQSFLGLFVLATVEFLATAILLLRKRPLAVVQSSTRIRSAATRRPRRSPALPPDWEGFLAAWSSADVALFHTAFPASDPQADATQTSEPPKDQRDASTSFRSVVLALGETDHDLPYHLAQRIFAQAVLLHGDSARILTELDTAMIRFALRHRSEPGVEADLLKICRDDVALHVYRLHPRGGSVLAFETLHNLYLAKGMQEELFDLYTIAAAMDLHDASGVAYLVRLAALRTPTSTESTPSASS